MEKIDDSIQKAFEYLGDLYQDMLCRKKVALTRDNIGFTERNLTFYFCSGYRDYKKEAVVWQELPIFEHHQHLDSIIVDKEHDNLDIYYIEAKRIYNVNYVLNENRGSHGSLREDYERLQRLFDEKEFVKKIPGLYDFQKGCTTVRHHIVLLASLEYKLNESPDTYNKRVKSIRDFVTAKKMNMLHYNVKDGFERPENDSKNELLYELKENDGQVTLSFVNLDLYLMIQDVKH